MEIWWSRRDISNLRPKGLVRVFAVIFGRGEQVAMYPPVVMSAVNSYVCVFYVNLCYWASLPCECRMAAYVDADVT